MDDQVRDLTISGSGTAPGGDYRNVIINGSGNVQGDLQCQRLEINGSGKILGNSKVVELIVSGSGVVEGNVTARKITINGNSRIEGNVTAEDLQINGTAKITGTVHGETIKSYGILTANGEIEAEELIAEGRILVDGLCSADRIDLKINGNLSRIREIGCSTLEVRRRPFAGFLSFLIRGIRKTGLTVDSIEGDEIYLEDTVARVVRGNSLVIGEGCDIEKAAYKNDYRQADNAKVKSAVRE
ncbi:polymer-forming cytoskeletal protein [Sporolactobacillus shoreae]|uniref:Polymer-forming cytoskeletal protein n=1 Tax=Sporolactobacillus shoreae TaxID=1465501 RepID=A0A4Z0GT95_9BACL|nr:polymer-forming cytoskeletal protein [Sporolactobacillus shoreae]TGB00439.1 polymer-forming cytoskeletal protein [Sporolactobacillus shoreae]